MVGTVAQANKRSSDSPKQLLKQTFAGLETIESGKFSLALTSEQAKDGSQAPSEQSELLKFNGAFQSDDRAKFAQFQLLGDLSRSALLTDSAQGEPLRDIGLVSTGKQGFVLYNGQSYQLPTWGQRSLQQLDRLLTLLQSLRWVKSARYVGEEQLEGTTVKHITGKVNFSSLANELQREVTRALSQILAKEKGAKSEPKGVTPQLQKQIVAGMAAWLMDQVKRIVQGATFDLYIGADDKQLHQLQFHVALRPDRSGGRKLTAINGTVTLDSINQRQTITAGADPRPFSELEKLLAAHDHDPPQVTAPPVATAATVGTNAGSHSSATGHCSAGAQRRRRHRTLTERSTNASL